MGAVYAAYDPQLNRKVAIKVLRSKAGDSVEAAELRIRMMREAQAIAKLSHPNVITVHDVGAFGDQVFVAMEFVDGHTLSYWMLAEPHAWPDVLRIFAEAGRGLAAAHEKDLVHRDFKPENVMIGADGQIRVMDFGLARTVEGSTVPSATGAPSRSGASLANPAIGPDEDVDSTRELGTPAGPAPQPIDGASDVMKIQITRTGAIVGTPAYMSPEQFLGQDTDARTDQFSFCVALYEALYGERPFAGRTLRELEANVLRGEVREASSKRRIPPGIRKLVLRGLKVNASERWPSMKALLRALEDNRLFAGRRRLASGASAKLSGVWEAPVRGRSVETPAKAEMRTAFLATGKSYAAAAFESASRILDAYAKKWSEMYVDICEATHVRGEQSPEVLDLRMACLLDCLEGLRALSRIFRVANAEVVENAVSAASALGGLERCADINLLRAGVRPPEDHETRVVVDQLRARLAEARALCQVGRYNDGLRMLVPLEQEARRVGYGALLAEILLESGKLNAERRDMETASPQLEEAVWVAELARHEEVVAEAAAYLVFTAGDSQLRFDAGEIWSRHAEVILQRMGGHDTVWGWLFNNRGAMREKQGRLIEALDDARRAVAAKERAGGVNSPDVALSLNNLALWLAKLGRVEEAALHIERGVRILEEELGAEHPRTAVILSNCSEILNSLGRFQEARAMSARVLSIFAREIEPDGSALTFPLMALGIACMGVGLVAEALPILERATAIRDAKETDPVLLGEAHFALARALLASEGDQSRARALAERARAEYGAAPQGPVTARELAKIDAWLSSHGLAHTAAAASGL